MKAKFLFASLLMGASIFASAQGVKDGIDFYNIGDYENAKTILDRNVNSASNKAEVDYYYGMIDLKQGDLNAADKYFKDGAAADAKYPFNLVGQAAVLLKNGNKSAAEALFKQARNLTKKNVDLECAIARAYFFADPTKYESQVNKCLLNARKYGKNSPQPDIVQGDIYFASQDWGNSMASYEQAMGYDPSNIESTVKYADTYFKVNPELAIARLKDIIQSNPNSALVQRQLAEKLYEHGDFVEAAQRYGNYINSTQNHFPKDEARYAQLLYFADKFQDCYDVASKLRSSVPAGSSYQVVADRLMLYSLANIGKWQEAYTVGKEMFSLRANDNNSYNLKDYLMFAKTCEMNNDADGATAMYDKAIELNPDNLEIARSLATQAAGAKDYVKALKYANKVLASDKVETKDYAMMANVYYQQFADKNTTAEDKANAYTQGINYIDKALSADPDNYSYVYRKMLLQIANDANGKGTAASTVEKYVQLAKAQNNVADFGPSLQYAYQYLAISAINNKDNAKALEYLRAWHELDPSNATVEKYIEALSK